MFTMKAPTPTELVHRVFLTVLLFGILGNCAESPQELLLGAEELGIQIGRRGEEDLPQKHQENQQQSQHLELEDAQQAKTYSQKNENNHQSDDDQDKDDDNIASSTATASLSRSIPFYYGNTNTKNYDSNYNDYDPYYRSPPASVPSSSYYYNTQRDRDRDRDRDRNYDRHGDRPSTSSTSSSTSMTPAGLPTVISSTSYSIKPGSGGSGSNVYINTKPVPIIVSSTGPSVQSDGDSRRDGNYYYSSNSRDRPGQGSYPPYDFPKRAASASSSSSDFNRNSNIYGSPSSTNFNLDCNNGPGHSNRRNCPHSNPKGDSYYNEDDNRSYYAVLNGNGNQHGSGGIRRYDDEDDQGRDRDRYHHATFPFTVRGLVPEKEKFYSDSEDDIPKRRVTRTSTTSSPPGWVKLQPIASRKTYDPFFSKEREMLSKKTGETSHQQQQSKVSKENKNTNPKDFDDDNVQGEDNINPNSKLFANRLGIELSPESFAERWGWGSGGSEKGPGSRLPSWLEELHNSHHQKKGYNRRPAYGTAHTGPTRDEDPQNWVKLEAIPVAGVSISKWVPKGTSPQELPSTGNLIRDRPSAWWDRPGGSNSVHKRPTFLHEHLNKGTSNSNSNSNINSNNMIGMMGWGSTSSSSSTPASTSTSRYPILTPHRRKPGSSASWNDIIYPDTPSSATASWESSGINSLNKGISSYPSSFPAGSMGWKSDHHHGSHSDGENQNFDDNSNSDNKNNVRRPVASWTAPGSNTHHRFGLRRPNLQSNLYSHLQPHSQGSSSGNPSSYPDPQANEDDPRWVLVSNSRRVSGPHQLPPTISDRHKYRPPLDRYKDDLDWDLDMSESDNDRNIDQMYGASSNSHSYRRVAKDYQLPPPGSDFGSSYSTSTSTRTETGLPPIPEIYTQDEAFQRVNATLQSLIPVLNTAQSSTSTRASRAKPTPKPPKQKQASTTTPKTTTTTTRTPLFNKIPASIRNTFFSSFMGSGRQASMDPLAMSNKMYGNNNETKIVISRKPNSLKPILAAVGAGMIPATMAAVLPMVMGRRKKRDLVMTNSINNKNQFQSVSQHPLAPHVPESEMAPVVFQNQLYLVPPVSENSSSRRENSRVVKNYYDGNGIVQSLPSNLDTPPSNAWASIQFRQHLQEQRQHRTRGTINTKMIIT